MPRKIDDIVPTNKKTIRDIPIPIRRSTLEREAPPQTREEPRMMVRDISPASVMENRIPDPRLNYPMRSTPTNSKRKFWISLVAGVVVLIGGFFSLKSGAVLSYEPKMFSLAFANEVFEASQNASGDKLSYSVVKISQDKSVEIPASGEETVSERARGTIVVYNKQTTSQDLVKTTRFETPEGKIYRIEKDITIPANGSVEVEVVADKAGATENIGLSDFTLPGLKGTAKFEKVFGRSKTSMTGGFIGTRKKVSQSDLNSTQTSLEGTLKNELLAQVGAQVPEDFVLFQNLALVSYEVLPVEAGAGDNAKVTVRGNLNAIIFKRQDLAQYLAVKKLEAKNVASEVDFKDLSKLNASFLSGALDTASSSSIRVNFVGSTDVVAVTDEEALKADLAGKSEEELQNILTKYPSIKEASVVLRPPWKSSFPSEATKIKIEVRE